MPNHTTKTKTYHGKPCKNCDGTLRYKSDRGCVTCAKARGKLWKENNPERVREHSNRWKKDNPEKIRVNTRRCYKNNPEAFLSTTRRRRARKRLAESEPYDFGAICAHYGNRCLGCGGTNVKLTVDHIKPIALGGDDIASNIQPLCKSCNSRKNARYIDYRLDAGPEQWIQINLFVENQ